MNTKISSLLQMSIALKKDVDTLIEGWQALAQRASKLPQEKLCTKERSKIIRDFVEDEKKSKGWEWLWLRWPFIWGDGWLYRRTKIKREQEKTR